MRATKAVNTSPIPGYRLIEPLGSGGFGEVWKCEAPGGLFKAIKFVYGNAGALEAPGVPAEEELRAIQHIKTIRHPFLLSLDRVEVIGGDLVIVMELADHSLHDVLVACRQEGLPGIERAELLGYLREAAEALDLMNVQYDLQHLDVKPRNLFLVSNHVKVADFGLVNSLGAKGGAAPQLGAITPLYAAPEAFTGAISRHCDQYSLAIVYQELLTGTLPFDGQNVRQLMLQHTHGEPDLGALPEADRPAVARALAKDPARRFASCSAFVRALLNVDRATDHRSVTRGASDLGGPTLGAYDTDSETDLSRDTPLPAAWARVGGEPGPVHPTAADPGARTEVLPGRAGARAPAPPDAAPPGYRFLGRVRSSPVAEVWQAQAPDGRARLVKFLYGFARPGAGSEEQAVGRLASLYHPGLAALEVARHDPGRLVVVTDAAEGTLWDRFQAGQAEGLPGIPRRELLGHLRAAAETLDYYAQQHGLQHLGLNPRALLLGRGRLRLADFGLADLLWAPAGQAPGLLNPRYAAPELFDPVVSRSCDQYSLALIYQELLTGAHPFRGRHRAGRQVRPDLDPLPAADREVVARALDPDPGQRWETCTELVRRLEAAGPDAAGPESEGGPLSVRQVITELLAAAAADAYLRQPGDAGPPSSADVVRQRYRSPLPPAEVRPRLELFRKQWNGQLVREDESGYVFQVVRALSFWQRCIGRQAGLEVHLGLAPADPAGPTEVVLHLKPFGCSGGQGAPLLKGIGPLLLDGAATCLEATAERRVQERLPWPHPLRVRPQLPGGDLGDEVECGGKNIALTGIGFHAPARLTATQLWLTLTTPFHPAPLNVPARVVRSRPGADGWCEVGAAFS
jgi:serine/threonine protein kinase